MIAEDELVHAWLAAARELGVEAIAPFRLTVSGREREYVALVPHFGGGKGIVVAGLPYDAASYLDAKSAGYRCSFLNAEVYRAYDRKLFVETLTEWGFTGPEQVRPSWLPR